MVYRITKKSSRKRTKSERTFFGGKACISLTDGGERECCEEKRAKE